MDVPEFHRSERLTRGPHMYGPGIFRRRQRFPGVGPAPFRRSLGFAGSLRWGVLRPRGQQPTTTRRYHPIARRPLSGHTTPAPEKIPLTPGGLTCVVAAPSSPGNSILVAAATQQQGRESFVFFSFGFSTL
jgi:hypothetical protein